MRRVTREDWDLEEVAVEFREIPYTDEFSSDEWRRLSHGLRPAEMEDKWFIFCEESTLHIHRSWTGRLVYRVEFDVSSEVSRVSQVRRAVAENLPDFDDEYDAALLRFLLRGLVLGQPEEFPIPESERSRAGPFQHHMAGTAAPHRTIPDRGGWWSYILGRLSGLRGDRKR